MLMNERGVVDEVELTVEERLVECSHGEYELSIDSLSQL